MSNINENGLPEENFGNPTKTRIRKPQTEERIVEEEKGGLPNPNNNSQNRVRRKPKNGSTEDTKRTRPNPQKQKHEQMGYTGENNTQSAPKKKKKGVGKFILIPLVMALVLVGLVVGKKFLNPKQVPAEVSYEGSGKEILDNFVSTLNSYNAETLDNCVGSENGDSYLAQEWSYANQSELREEFIQRVSSTVRFRYPKMNQLDTNGNVMIGDDGNPIEIDSLMNADEQVTVTIPDYNAIVDEMESDRDYIERLLEASGYTSDDYTYADEMFDLLMQYVCDKEAIPTTTVDISIPIKSGCVESDAELDNLLFGSDAFHTMIDKFSQIVSGWTGYEDEVYMDKENQHNPEYDEWYKIFKKYYDADNGVFNKNTSKWEPWYLRDDDNNYVYDENGNKIVNYYSVKKEDGSDWIQPDETIVVEVEKTRQVEAEWIPETVITYTNLGAYYIQNEYEGSSNTAVRVGDGSKERPAGIGTDIITKVLCTDGKYRDVKVAVIGYWTGQDAIDYAEMFSTKNRGFTTESVVQLICYEIRIMNLEDEPIEFEASEMTLADSNTNIAPRTGTMYGFTEIVNLDAKETKIINDWGSSTELAQKYVCWGKSFSKAIPMVYFDILAGTGDVPPYSAYEQFTGKGELDETDSTDIDE